MDFSETIVACDFKLMDLKKICEYCRSRSFLDLGPRLCTEKKFKQDFLRNYSADLSQIFYECFQVQGNENLMT